MIATVGIFAFVASWNDYMMTPLILTNPHLQTIPVQTDHLLALIGTRTSRLARAQRDRTVDLP